MQAIEFETHLENGLIHLPASYQHWQNGKQVKVILLVDETAEDSAKQQNELLLMWNNQEFHKLPPLK